MNNFDAIVLAGGASRRLDGEDKAMLVMGGITLLDRAIDAVSAARRVVCVGPERPTERTVTWTSEEPVGGGPAAGIVAGLELVDAPVCIVLSVDTPFVDAHVIERLVQGCTSSVGAVVADDDGRLHPLVGAYPTAVLRASAALLADPNDAAVAQLLSAVPYSTVEDDRAARDCNTWEDVERARAVLDEKA